MMPARNVTALITALSLAAVFFGLGNASAETVRYGVGGNEWSSFGIADETDTGTGGLDLVIEQDGLTFTLNVVSTAASGGELQMSGGGALVPATSGNIWEDGDGTLVFTLTVGDPSSILDTIKVGNIDLSGWNGADEDMQFTALGSSVTKDPTTGGVSGGVVSYDTLGLTQLSTSNIGTWSLEMDMVDVGRIGGLDSIEFVYTRGGDSAIPTLDAGSVTELTENGVIDIDVSLDQAVTDLSPGDFDVVNGTAGSLTGSGAAYILSVSPNAAAGNTLSVTLPETRTTPSNVASNTLEFAIVAGVPVPTLSAGSSSVDIDGTIDITVSFDLPVTSLSGGDFSLINASVADFTGSNDTYTLTLSPTGDAGDIISVSLPEDITIPANVESNTLQIGITSDGVGEEGIQLSDVYANDLVFQRDQIIPLTGTGFPGETITVTFKTREETTTVAADGSWLVHLDPEPASPDSSQLTVSGSVSTNGRSIRARVGEVWMCAGQSNMADSFDNPPPALEAEYQAWLSGGDFDHFYFSSRGDGWKRIEDAKRNIVSRTAFYFGMELYKTLNPDPNNITIPVGIIISANGGTPIQSWMPAEDAEVIRQELGIQENWNDWENKENIRGPGAQWDDKVDHIPPHSIRGVVWYQGERNAKSEMGYEYDLLLEHHVETWRRIWAERAGLPVTNFPFYYIEVSHRHERTDYEFAWLRDRLRRAMDIIPNSAMAHFYDGGPDLHPENKQLAGQRLALLARKNIYGETGLVAQGPLLDTVSYAGGQATLSFTGIGSGLVSVTDPVGGTLEFFEIAGADVDYKPATATIVGDTVVVQSAEVSDPAYVRYLFQVSPTQPAPDYSLANAEGIPAATFMTDDLVPPGRTGGLTPAQYNDMQKARNLVFTYEFHQGGADTNFRYSYEHDDTIDQVNIRFYMSDNLVDWVEVAASNDGAPPANTDEATYGNWIFSVGGSEGDRYRDVIIQDPNPVGSQTRRFYKFGFSP